MHQSPETAPRGYPTEAGRAPASTDRRPGRNGRLRLDRAEEERLFGVVVAGRAAAEALAADPDTPRREIHEWDVRAGAEARTIILEAHQTFVAIVASRYRHSGVPMADLIQEGNIGLISALERFDPEVGVRFATFASFWVRRTILAGIPLHRRGMSLSPRVAREVYRLRKIRASLESKLGREPTSGEVAEVAGMTPTRARRIEALNLPHQPLTDAVTSNVAVAEEEAIWSEPAVQVDAIRDLVAKLSPREQFVISHRFGLGCAAQLQTEVAEALGVSGSRVSQIERQALEHLRRLAVGQRDTLLVA
ncbi:MAG TPA: sigma-70 family RNA polymerase sigma factor [Acidimicrobiia bacterium]|nr:sigma-70 family RNA polymerase sigma factor [Acidimicrobiia bacterium]